MAEFYLLAMHLPWSLLHQGLEFHMPHVQGCISAVSTNATLKQLPET